jgi:hypothetical protein
MERMMERMIHTPPATNVTVAVEIVCCCAAGAENTESTGG